MKKNPLDYSREDSELPEKVEYSDMDREIDLDRSLSTLPEMESLCIVLAYHQGMSHGMISEHTGMPLGTVKSYIRRGAQRLQELLKPYKYQE